MFDADDGGSAAPRREDMILPVQACRHQHDVDDSRTSRWHRNADVDNKLELCRHRDDVDGMSRRHSFENVVDMGPWHRHGVDKELSSELSHSDMHLLGRGNAQSSLVGAIAINDTQGTEIGGSQHADTDGGMPTIKQIEDAQLQDEYCIKVRKDPSATEGDNNPFKEIDGVLHLRTEGALDDDYLMIVPHLIKN